MNRIVREHYPVSNLPADLREGFKGQTDVRVTIDAGPDSNIQEAGEVGRTAPFSERFKRFRHVNFASSEDVVADVRALRDD